METYKDFTSIETNELIAIRNGFFNPVFTITDGNFMYGKVILNKTSKALPVLETLGESWTLKRQSIFGDRTLHILNAVGEPVGTVTNGDTYLKMADGFDAYLAGPWFDTQHNKLVAWKQSSYSYRKPFKITVDRSLVKTMKEMPLLVLLGTYLIFLEYTRSLA